MPKPSIRGSELPQRQSPRLRTSSPSISSEPKHLNRPITDRSPKLGLDRRSPRSGGPHTDPLTQKKLGSRISGLESQLGQAQEELRLLKQQLARAEAAKKCAQEELHHKKISKKPNPSVPERDEIPGDGHQDTDVFEVLVEEAKEGEKVKKSDELASKEDQINVLKARLYDLEKEKVSLGEENASLKDQLKRTGSEMSTAKAKEDEIASKVSRIEEELEESNETTAKLKKKLESMEDAKESLEAEMKKLKVQTEQWRKAADAAAAVLSGGVEMNGRFSERCGSMETHFAGRFVGSPGMADDLDDGLGFGKRKGSGMKMFGDLWKKKGQK
ncbi:PREDICTED: interactor of constitutive active ROPs 4-like [Camelina sativa]|uniref:Interactor of constitutive active ROPs 4-like n=1 Tax=Camelina sativa TaxID=90675 RepID=A0ABM0TNK7_CAMSA|nr:PREDICTED: interactor of constitutive active ROPs 4-like [Camelina sativa]XP_010428970.1 PREDICTED: interactor of constitutive active ROPs 4-like [Camelina sativa]XP_010428971.1 PREDICTED: interactor of constitutive active ROPs 4-like [Camelina sativa]